MVNLEKNLNLCLGNSFCFFLICTYVLFPWKLKVRFLMDRLIKFQAAINYNKIVRSSEQQKLMSTSNLKAEEKGLENPCLFCQKANQAEKEQVKGAIILDERGASGRSVPKTEQFTEILQRLFRGKYDAMGISKCAHEEFFRATREPCREEGEKKLASCLDEPQSRENEPIREETQKNRWINTSLLIKEAELEIKSIISSVLFETDPSTESQTCRSEDLPQGDSGTSQEDAKRKNKLPKHATDTLQDWFLKNLSNPYPSY